MKTQLVRFAVAFVIFGSAACSSRADLTKIPPGSEVQVVGRDGGVVQGRLKRVTGTRAVIEVGSRERTLSTDDVTHVRSIDPRSPDTAEALPAAAKFRSFVVPSGTALSVRLETPLASNTSHVGDEVKARVASPVVIDQSEVLSVGSVVTGKVSEVQPSGRVRGRAAVAVEFDRLTDHDGVSYPIAARAAAHAASTKRTDAEKIAAPAAGGAIIGGILGGKSGAGIGAAIGGGAGTAVVLTTPGHEIQWPEGSLVSLTLAKDVDVKVPLHKS